MDSLTEGHAVEVVLGKTNFYIQSGGQVSDTGMITALDGTWQIRVDDVRKPHHRLIVHAGVVLKGTPTVGEMAFTSVDLKRRQDIMRNHTAPTCCMPDCAGYWVRMCARRVRWLLLIACASISPTRNP